MALLDQLRLLDRALRDVRVREALRTGDRGGRRLARFAGSVAPADLAVLRAVDARRFEAVAQRQAELIRDRWWTPRFPGILLGAAKAVQGTTRDVALGALASAAYERREGADETGAALIGFVLGREDQTADPVWLKDLVAYEYLIAVGLPRRSKGESIDAALETRVFPEGTRFIGPPSKKSKASELALAQRVVVLPLEFPVSQVREALLAGQEVADEIESEPHVLVFVLEADAANEHPFPARAHDALDMIVAAPLEGQKLLDAFEPYDRIEVFAVLEQLRESGVIAGALPAKPEEVERPAEDERPGKGKKSKGKNKGGAGKADSKNAAKKPDAKAAGAKSSGAKSAPTDTATVAKTPTAGKAPAPAKASTKAPAPAKGKPPAKVSAPAKAPAAAKAPAPAKGLAAAKAAHPKGKAPAPAKPATKAKPAPKAKAPEPKKAKAPSKAALAPAKKSAARRR